jgi:hypothetical protein
VKRIVVAALTAVLGLVMVAAPATAYDRSARTDGLPPGLKVGT